MFGRKKAHVDETDEEIPVDATLVGDIQVVEQAVAQYLEARSDACRQSLLEALETLDAQTARGDAFQNTVIGSPGLGYTASEAVLGQTSIDPVVDEVRAGEMRAHVALVKAAKAEIRSPSPATLVSLQSAIAALAAARSREVPET